MTLRAVPADAPLRNEYYQTSGFDEEAGQLNEEALKAVRLWRFEPGTLRGNAVPVLVTGTLSFRLH